MTADVLVTNGGISSARIITSGSGFQQGDVLGIGTLTDDTDGTNINGRNARMSIVSIGQTTELILDNVQGNFVIGAGKTMFYNHPTTGIATQLNFSS